MLHTSGSHDSSLGQTQRQGVSTKPPPPAPLHTRVLGIAEVTAPVSSESSVEGPSFDGFGFLSKARTALQGSERKGPEGKSAWELLQSVSDVTGEGGSL